ncbi:hypothetical protein LCGC14_2830250, partial [marine sediment metagenome]
YKGRAFAAFALAVLLTSMSVVQPWLVRPLFNKGFGTAEGVKPDFEIVRLIVSIMVGLLVLRTIGQVFQLRLSLGLGTLVSRHIRNMVYAHMHKLSLSFFAKKQTGTLVTRVTSDTERLWYFVSSVFIDMVLAVMMLIGVGVCVFVMDWKLASFSLLPFPLMFALIVVFHKRLHRSFGRMWHRWGQMTSVVAGALPGVRVIKAFSQENQEVRRFEDKSNALYNVEKAYIAGVRSLFGPTMMLCSSLGTLIVWMLGGWWLSQGKTDLGTLASFQMFLAMFMRPINRIAHMDEMFNRAATSAQRIFDILDTQLVVEYVSSTATSGAATTLTDTTQSWSTDLWLNKIVKITGGTGVDQSRTIASNTATVLTVSSAWAINPDATSTYKILAGGGVTDHGLLTGLGDA